MNHQFNIQQFSVLPTRSLCMCFVWISEQTAIISLYSISWLVFITETECVYCAVRTGCFTFSENHVYNAGPPVSISIAEAACIRRKSRTRPPTVQRKLFHTKFSKGRPQTPNQGSQTLKYFSPQDRVLTLK